MDGDIFQNISEKSSGGFWKRSRASFTCFFCYVFLLGFSNALFSGVIYKVLMNNHITRFRTVENNKKI